MEIMYKFDSRLECLRENVSNILGVLFERSAGKLCDFGTSVSV